MFEAFQVSRGTIGVAVRFAPVIANVDLVGKAVSGLAPNNDEEKRVYGYFQHGKMSFSQEGYC